VEGGEDVPGKAEGVEGARLGEVGGEAYDGAEAVGDGHDGEAQVEVLAGVRDADAAFLGDVEAVGEETSEDHEAEDGRLAEVGREGLDAFEETIEAEADVGAGGEGFEVEVGSAGGKGAGEEGVDVDGGIGGVR
jgi:hypothetical protein